MKELLDALELEKPDVRSVMLNALKNVKESHLLDARFIEHERKEPQVKRRLQVIG